LYTKFYKRKRNEKNGEKIFFYNCPDLLTSLTLSLSKNYIDRLIKDIAGAFILALYYLSELAIRDKRIAMIDLYDL